LYATDSEVQMRAGIYQKSCGNLLLFYVNKTD